MEDRVIRNDMAVTGRLALPRQMAGLPDSPNLQPQAPPLRFQHSLRIAHGFRCLSRAPDNSKKQTPQVLRIAVSGVTELLRLLSSFNDNQTIRVTEERGDDFSVSSVDDVVTVLKSDYQNAYFVTGVFSSAIYAEDCIFEDPTIRFRGKELYSRNLKLLVPFFESPSIGLEKIEKDITSKPNVLVATWKLRPKARQSPAHIIGVDLMSFLHFSLWMVLPSLLIPLNKQSTSSAMQDVPETSVEASNLHRWKYDLRIRQ